MKSRIQMAGVPYGSEDMVLWKGDLPQLSGMPGMRIVLNDLGADDESASTTAYQFKQVVLEIDKNSNDIEQVVYVAPVDRSMARELLETK